MYIFFLSLPRPYLNLEGHLCILKGKKKYIKLYSTSTLVVFTKAVQDAFDVLLWMLQ